MDQKQNRSFVDAGLGIIIFAGLFFSVLVGGTLLSGGMLVNLANIRNIGIQSAVTIILSVGFMLVMRAGGVDWSVGSILALCAVIAAGDGELGAGGVAVALVVALIAGSIQGVLAVFAKIPSVLFTLFTASFYRGLAYMITSALPVPIESVRMAQGPLFLGVVLVCVTGAFLLVCFAPLGKPMKERVHREKGEEISHVLAYAVCSLMAGVAGILLTVRIMAAQPALGSGYEVNALVICLAAGCSTLFDNRFMPIVATMIAAIMFTVLNNVMVLIGLSSFFQMIMTALVGVLALALDRVYRRNYLPVSMLERKAKLEAGDTQSAVNG